MPSIQVNTSQNNTIYGTITSISILGVIPMVLISIASFGGNALVLVAIYRFKNLQTFTNAYIGSLAITDVVASLLMPFTYTTVLLNGKWIFGDAMCAIQGFFLTMLSSASLLTLLFFSVYRCYLVTTVTKRLSEMKLGRVVKISVGLIWFLSLLYSIPPLFGGGQVEYISTYCSCSLNFASSNYYSEFLLVFVFTIPSIVMIVAYVKIIKFMKIHNQTMMETKAKARQQRTRSVLLISSSDPSPEDGSHCSIMELKRKLDRLNDEDDNAEGEQRCEELEEDGRKWESSDMKPESKFVVELQQLSSFNLKSEFLSDKVQSYSPQEITFLDNGNEGEPSIENLSKSKLQLPVSSVMQKLRARTQRQKALQQYAKCVSRQSRLARILLATVVMFFICWGPFAIDSFLLGIGHTQERPKNLQLVIIWFAYANALCNPTIYALLNTQFRNAFKTILKKLVELICICHQ